MTSGDGKMNMAKRLLAMDYGMARFIIPDSDIPA